MADSKGDMAPIEDKGGVASYPPLSPRTRYAALCLLYVAVAGILAPLEAVYWRASLDFLPQWHASMLDGTAHTVNQFRVLSFLLPEFIHRTLGFSLLFAYLAQRFLYLALILCLLHRYLGRWFDEGLAMAGTLYFAAILPITSMDMIQPSEPLNVLVFLLGFWAIREGRVAALAAFVVLGALNKDTTAFLVPCYLLVHWGSRPWRKLLAETGLLAALFFAVYSAVRLYYHAVFKTPPGLYEFQIDYNLQAILLPAFTDLVTHLRQGAFFVARPYLSLLLYGAMWILPFLRFREKPAFFRRLALITPLFLLGHFFVGRLDESRLFLPLFPLLVPMGLMTLFGTDGEGGKAAADSRF
ncbi:MAG: hypothetical protein C4523_12015 [Myxococcales bacterium]|nr:MAG: hypothetical protein C4523_12015 [Myxococcales bacterium]